MIPSPLAVPHRNVVAVVAHPDDETFGLGALLAALAAGGRDVRVVCLTAGEASTLGARPDLADVRRAELECAARRLGVGEVILEGFPDGALSQVPPAVLDSVVERHLHAGDLVVVFEPGGVTGHPDHQAASAAAIRVASRLDACVMEWGVAPDVAAALRREVGAAFAALDGDGTADVIVDRSRQRSAIDCHASQVADNPVLPRRLRLQGDRERIRLTHPGPDVLASEPGLDEAATTASASSGAGG